MELFEKYAFMRSYSAFLQTELKRERIRIGQLQSDLDELKFLSQDAILKIEEKAKFKKLLDENETLREKLKEERKTSTDLLFKNNGLTTQLIQCGQTPLKKYKK